MLNAVYEVCVRMCVCVCICVCAEQFPLAKDTEM